MFESPQLIQLFEHESVDEMPNYELGIQLSICGRRKRERRTDRIAAKILYDASVWLVCTRGHQHPKRNFWRVLRVPRVLATAGAIND